MRHQVTQALAAIRRALTTGWYEYPSMDFALDVPGVGQFKLFDPSTDEQLSSGFLVLSLNNKWLLKQRGGNGILGKLAGAINRQIRAGIEAALELWLQDDSEWVEQEAGEWPRYGRKFQLEHNDRLLPQDCGRVCVLYRLFTDPLSKGLRLTRDGCVWFAFNDPMIKTSDTRVQQLYNKLCQRPPLVA